jgi:NitT/TauT family transport system substrate-binding protein
VHNVKFRSKLSLAGAVTMLALAVSALGCGDSDDAAGTGSGDELEEVTVSLPGDFIGMAPYYIAIDKGFFKERGIDLKVVRTNGGPVTVAAVTSGSADIGETAMSTLLTVADQGQQLRVVSPLSVRSQVTCVANPDAAKDLPQTSAPWEERVKALKGATIGVASVGGGGAKQVEYMVAKAGLDPARDIKQVAVGGDPASNQAALERGLVGVLCTAVPITEAAAAGSNSSPYVNASEIPGLGEMVDAIMFTSQKVVEEKPEMLQNFRDALQDGMDFLKANPAEGKAIVKENGFTNFDTDAFNDGWDKLGEDGFAYSTALPDVGYQQALDYTSFVLGKELTMPAAEVEASATG